MRILMIEDYEPLRKSLTQGLREAGFAVDATKDGDEGLDRREGRPTVGIGRQRVVGAEALEGEVIDPGEHDSRRIRRSRLGRRREGAERQHHEQGGDSGQHGTSHVPKLRDARGPELGRVDP